MEILSSNKRFSIKQIFKDHWYDFLNNINQPLPDYILDNINKILSCRDPNILGYHKYACPQHPDCYVVIPHSCKSRFCNCCSKILTDNWLEKINSILPNVSYYHITFTIPDSLRELFRINPSLLSCLFSSAAKVILSWSKQKNFLPIVICVLHTFGKDLKFNPHIHMIISAGGLSLKKKTNTFITNLFLIRCSTKDGRSFF